MAKDGAWRIGVAGLGTVGAGLLRLIDERPRFSPVGREVVVTGVCARSRTRPRPVDISNLVLFLASDEARYITGQQIRVDAGSLLKFPNGPGK